MWHLACHQEVEEVLCKEEDHWQDWSSCKSHEAEEVVCKQEDVTWHCSHTCQVHPCQVKEK